MEEKIEIDKLAQEVRGTGAMLRIMANYTDVLADNVDDLIRQMKPSE